jgi:hypothetical protein
LRWSADGTDKDEARFDFGRRPGSGLDDTKSAVAIDRLVVERRALAFT